MSVRLPRLLLLETAWGLLTITASGDECTLQLANNAAVTEYSAIVAQYRAGQFTDAGEGLRALSEDGIERAIVHVRTNGWPDGCVRAASMLHTEVGMESILRESPERYFDRAWTLTSIVRDDDDKRRLQRDWLLLMGLFYQKLMFDPEIFSQRRTEVLSLGTELYRGAQRYFDEAVEAFPRDPEILVAAGTLFEWAGAPNFGERSHLAKAVELYKLASRVDPKEPIAQLRYGITLWKRGRAEESVAPLGRVLELTDDDDLVFRSRLALGRIAMLNGRHEEAIAHFRAAVALKPDWQVGALALSHALHRNGARDESREVLRRVLNVSWTDDNIFGWWSYEAGLSGRFGPLLESMRAEVLSW